VMECEGAPKAARAGKAVEEMAEAMWRLEQ
jgi:hypothetical protein